MTTPELHKLLDEFHPSYQIERAMRDQMPFPMRNVKEFVRATRQKNVTWTTGERKTISATNDALHWLRTSAKKRTPESKHLRRIVKLIHDHEEVLWDFESGVNDAAKVLYRVRNIDFMSMITAIQLFCVAY